MDPALGQFGRFARPARQVLAALTAGPREPFAIRHEVHQRFGIELGPGTLFGTIARLERRALIEVVPTTTPPRAYRITALGAETLEAQLAALARSAPAALPASKLSAAR